MLIDMDITIAYKCFSCGTFDFTNVNLFKLFLQGSFMSKCRCGEAEQKILRISKNKYSINVPCIWCGSAHSHTISREQLISNEITIIKCPLTNTKQCFIGCDHIVRDYIDSFEKELDIIMDGLGYDNYFFNNQVMLDTLNKIHDIAEQRNLYCTCGCNEIMVALLEKGISLKCGDCMANKFIPAATNTDLKETLQKARIVLRGKNHRFSYHTKV